MKLAITLFILMTSILGCSNNNGQKHEAEGELVLPKQLQDTLEETARTQADGLTNSTARIHRAYEYSGYAYFTPPSNAKKIAIDLELSNHSKGLDLDDVEVIDGKTGQSYGSYPHIGLLQADGELAPDQYNWPISTNPLRVLLVYAVPKTTTSIELSYWGQKITTAPTTLSGSGPSLARPSAK